MKNNIKSLSEHESKRLLAGYGIPVTREILAHTGAGAVAAAREIGFPVAVKACGKTLVHKTESDAVFLNIGDEAGVNQAFERISENLSARIDGVLVQEMVTGIRELVIGLHREPHFGPCVMLGAGGVTAELINDTSFRVAPIDEIEAGDMMNDLASRAMLESFRGQAPVDRKSLCRCLTAMGQIGLEHDEVYEIDINPMIIKNDGQICAADALVVVRGKN
ncbi:MAG: carboxylate--amine ligase [Deltaproteobacteria bacterium]|nr:carboxylate--amine ligase [Deltaproteobacteria bacterium]